MREMREERQTFDLAPIAPRFRICFFQNAAPNPSPSITGLQTKRPEIDRAALNRRCPPHFFGSTVLRLQAKMSNTRTRPLVQTSGNFLSEPSKNYR